MDTQNIIRKTCKNDTICFQIPQYFVRTPANTTEVPPVRSPRPDQNPWHPKNEGRILPFYSPTAESVWAVSRFISSRDLLGVSAGWKTRSCQRVGSAVHTATTGCSRLRSGSKRGDIIRVYHYSLSLEFCAQCLTRSKHFKHMQSHL